MAKILCVLYDDPIGGYPKSYARDGIPRVDRYPGGQSAPTPKHIDSSQASFSVLSRVNLGCANSSKV